MILRQVLSAAQRSVPESNDGDVVLAYHLVGAGSRSPVDIDVATFREQLTVLAEEHTVAPLAELGGASGSVRPRVVLTFDDTFQNFRRVVWPILSEYGFPATLYVPVGFVDGSHGCPIRGAALPACSWDDLRALAGEGVEIGSHTVSHVNLRRAAPDVVERELSDSRRRLEDAVGRPVTSFCYPQAKLTRRVAAAVRRHYRTGVTAGGRRFRSGVPLERIPRFPIRRDGGDFRGMLRSSVWLPEFAAHVARQWIR